MFFIQKIVFSYKKNINFKNNYPTNPYFLNFVSKALININAKISNFITNYIKKYNCLVFLKYIIARKIQMMIFDKNI